MTAGRSGGGSAGGLLIQESIGGTSSLMLPLSWLWQLTPLFAVIAFAFSRRKNLYSLIVLIPGLLVIFSFFLSGSRGNMMFVAAPVLFFLVYYNWHKGLKFWIPSICCLMILTGIMELQVRFRGNLIDVLSDPSKATKAQNFQSATTFNLTQSQRDNNMYLLCLIVKGFPEKYSYQGFDDFFAILANPIPRAFWPGKPILQGAKDISEQYPFILDGPLIMGTTSLTYSVVGESLKTNGIYGIIVYTFIYSLFLSFFDSLIYYTQRKQVLSVAILGLAIFLAFWGFRSFNAFVTFTYPFLLLLLIVRIVSFAKRKVPV